jgi:uncharacterized protein
METEYRLGCAAHSRDDYATALERWEPIAIRGHSKAQYLLGCLHDQGHGAIQDDEEAVKWFRVAAEQNNADAQFALGEKYLTGKGVARDVLVATKWYICAFKNGHSLAGDRLDEVFYFGGSDYIKEANEALSHERELNGLIREDRSG